MNIIRCDACMRMIRSHPKIRTHISLSYTRTLHTYTHETLASRNTHTHTHTHTHMIRSHPDICTLSSVAHAHSTYTHTHAHTHMICSYPDLCTPLSHVHTLHTHTNRHNTLTLNHMNTLTLNHMQSSHTHTFYTHACSLSRVRTFTLFLSLFLPLVSRSLPPSQVSLSQHLSSLMAPQWLSLFRYLYFVIFPPPWFRTHARIQLRRRLTNYVMPILFFWPYNVRARYAVSYGILLYFFVDFSCTSLGEISFELWFCRAHALRSTPQQKAFCGREDWTSSCDFKKLLRRFLGPVITDVMHIIFRNCLFFFHDPMCWR